jgi:hypothetical protein
MSWSLAFCGTRWSVYFLQLKRTPFCR